MWSWLLDGAHLWGSSDAVVSRYGVRHYRLTVYPPGISTADRRLVRVWRCWPVSGALLGVLALMVLGNAAATPDTVLAATVSAYLGIGALLFLRAGPARFRVRSLSIVLMPGSADVNEQHKFVEWQAMVHMLTAADRGLTGGAIAAVEHEAIWWEVYDRLGALHV